MEYDIITQRLGLRNWLDTDIDWFSQMNSNPKVMKYFPKVLTPKESAASIERFRVNYAEEGFTYFVAEKLKSNTPIGFVGILKQDYSGVENWMFDSVFYDIGWRLLPEYWGRGYATEAAKACITYGFDQLNKKKIVAHAANGNTASTAVMEKIGMRKIRQFKHPKITSESPLQPCVWYEIENKNRSNS